MATLTIANTLTPRKMKRLTTFISRCTPSVNLETTTDEITFWTYSDVELETVKGFVNGLVENTASSVVISFTSENSEMNEATISDAIYYATGNNFDIVDRLNLSNNLCKIDDKTYILYFNSPFPQIQGFKHYLSMKPILGIEVFSTDLEDNVQLNRIRYRGKRPTETDSEYGACAECILVHKDRFAYYNQDDIERVVENVNLYTRDFVFRLVYNTYPNGVTAFYIPPYLFDKVYCILSKELEKIKPVFVGEDAMAYIRSGANVL